MSFDAQTGTVAAPSDFDDTDILDYDIVCDTTGPIARGGPNRGLVLVDGMAEVLLDGGASSDPESGIASHTWTCGNSQSPIMAPQAICTYTFAGSFTATLRLT